MAVSGGPDIVETGLCEVLEASLASTGTFTIPSKPFTTTFSVNNFTQGNVNGNTVLQSNVDSSGAGTSFITVPRNTNVETGAITVIVWFDFQGIPINVGANNNWRLLFCPRDGAGAPVYFIIEQSGVINFSTITTDSTTAKRYLDGNFNPVSYNTNGWQMVSFTYDNATGIGSAYKNATLIRSGFMSEASRVNPTSPGIGLSYTAYTVNNGFRLYGGTNTGANPSGNGICPGLLGNVLVYNRALTPDEILQNYNALQSRFGV